MMLRRLHTWVSILSAPTILFFALSGALQLFDWHEPRGAYHPPAWIEKLGMLHKKQRFAVHGAGPGPGFNPGAAPGRAPGGGAGVGNRIGPGRPDAPRADGAPGGRRPPPATLRTLLLRWFFLFATLSLAASTLMGIWIALTHPRRRRQSALLLLAGTLIPVLMLAL